MGDGGDWVDLDSLVAEVLSTFDLAGCEQETRWRAYLTDLRQILAADYRGTVRTLYRSGVFPVRMLVREVRRQFPEFNRQPMQFDTDLRSGVAALGIKLRMQEYARRRPLRGFYHSEAASGSLIWINLAHHPGAVAATLAHELGHWYRERLLGAPADGTSIPFLNAKFAAHLTRGDELFADVFVVLAAYPRRVAAPIFSRARLGKALTSAARFDRATLRRLRQHLRANYGFDIHEQSGLQVPRRIYYLTSALHFARLRWAVLQEIGV